MLGKDNYMKDWQYRLLALLLAIFVWYLVSGREKVEYWMEVPIEVSSLPENFIITGGVPSKIQVRVRGTRPVLERIQQGKYSYNLDLSDIKLGDNVIILESKHLKFPPPVEVVAILPPRLELDIDKLMQKNVAIQVNWTSSFKEFSKFFELKEINCFPNKILISGPSSIVNKIDKLETKEIKVDPFKDRIYVQNVPLNLDPRVNSEVGSVEVRLVIEPKRKEVWIVRNIQFINPGGKKIKNISKNYKCKLKFSVPLYLWKDNKWKEGLKVFVKVPITSGSYELPLQVETKKDILILEKDPSYVKITVE